jgi:hypothetical protein
MARPRARALYRLLRIALFDTSARAPTAATRGDGRHQEMHFEDWVKDGSRQGATWTVRHGNAVEHIDTHRNVSKPAVPVSHRRYHDYKAISAFLRAAGIPLVLVGYPRYFVRITRVMKQTAEEDAVRFLDSAAPWPGSRWRSTTG